MLRHTRPSARPLSELLEANRLPEGKRSPRGLKAKLLGLTLVGVTALVGGAVLTAFALPSTLVAAGGTHEAIRWWDELPSTLKQGELPQRTQIVDRQGKRIGQLYTENRVVIPLKRMGETAPAALIATEDSRFYEHRGLDAQGLGRAVVNNLFSDSTQGASTLTQQLVENIRMYEADTAEERAEAKAQSPAAKLEELRYATGIEQSSSKDEILEAYLNIVYFGNGAYGIEAAAQRYFSVPARKLTVPQAATLIALLKSPTAYDPVTRPKDSRLRRDVVMKRMVEERFITEKEYRQFIKKKTPLKLSEPRRGCGKSKYPFYCQLIVEHILSAPAFGKTAAAREKFLANGGLTITAALSPKAMAQTQAAVDRALGRGNRVAAGLAMVQPGTGQVLAVAQNRSWGVPAKGAFDKTEIVYANTPRFQVGSTFKPITAAAALEEGFSPATKLNAPNGVFYDGLDAPEGGFKNDSRSGYGYIDLPTAFKFSVNTFFVNLTQQTGVRDVASMARRLGMESMPENLTGREGSITLGAYESSPLELANVYATFAGRGVACDPVFVLKIKENETGEELAVPDGDCRQELSPAVADTISATLQAPFSAGGTAQKLKIGRPATGKTGTTDNAAATWFAGYTPQAATAVWIGDPRGGQSYPLYGVSAYGTYYANVYGGTIAGPIWQDAMSSFHKGLPVKWYPKPGGVSASMSSRVVPTVVGISLDSAVTLLLKSGFQVEVEKKTASLPSVDKPNFVARQTPRGGGKAAHGDTVVLTLTEGSATNVRLPSSYEDLKARAERKLAPTEAKD